MDRRRFLVATGAGSGALLSGCVTTQGDNPLAQIGLGQPGALQNVLQGALGVTNGNGARRRLDPQANLAAYQAYGEFFRQMEAAGGPTRITLPGTQASLEQVTGQATQFIDSLPDEVSDIQMAQTWERIAPLVNHLERVRG